MKDLNLQFQFCKNCVLPIKLTTFINKIYISTPNKIKKEIKEIIWELILPGWKVVIDWLVKN